METQKTHWKVLVNPNYIGAYMVQSDLTVRITSVVREVVKGENGKSEECTVAHLEGTKPLILNRTNSKTITRIYGTPFIEDWVGKWITLFPTTTKVAGETVECLRIRPTKPVQGGTVKPVDYTNQIATLRGCTTLENLQFEYTALDRAAQAALVKVKDEMKKKLTPSNELQMLPE
jgi:hypothetical protein